MLFEALDRVLPTEDADISKLAERGLKKQGMTIHTDTLVQDIESGEDSVTFTYGDAARARPTGWSSPPAAAPTSRRSASRRPGSSSTSTG